MTNLEICLIGFVWILVGTWVCFKRKWYQQHDMSANEEIGAILQCVFGVVLAPINLLITLIRVFVIDSWKHIDDWKDQGLRK